MMLGREGEEGWRAEVRGWGPLHTGHARREARVRHVLTACRAAGSNSKT